MGLWGDIASVGGELLTGDVGGAIEEGAEALGLTGGQQSNTRSGKPERAGFPAGPKRPGRGTGGVGSTITGPGGVRQMGGRSREPRPQEVPENLPQPRQQGTPERRSPQQQAFRDELPMQGQIGQLPQEVGSIRRKDGSVGPIRRCPKGMVLAIDDRCYPKSMVSKKFRKWPPKTKPPVTRSEWKSLLDARKAAKGIKRMARKLLDVQGRDRKSLPVDDD